LRRLVAISALFCIVCASTSALLFLENMRLVVEIETITRRENSCHAQHEARTESALDLARVFSNVSDAALEYARRCQQNYGAPMDEIPYSQTADLRDPPKMIH